MRGAAGSVVVATGVVALLLAVSSPATASVRCALPQAPGLDSGVHHQGDYDYLMWPNGPARALVLQVDFEDAPGTDDPGAEVDAVLQAGPWYQSASYGRFALEVDGLRRWLRMPRPKADYKGPPELLVRDAIAAADPEVDFGRYDLVLAAFPPGSGLGAIANVLRRGEGIVADGREIRHLARFYSGAWTTFAHEMAHTFGLTDLYAAGAPPIHVGIWDLMSFGKRAGFLAWHKWKLGWLDADQIDCVTRAGISEHTLAPLAAPGGTKAVVVRTGDHSAIVAENRQPMGHDEGLCRYGVLVYVVDTRIGWGQGPIKVKPAKEDTDLTGCGRLHNAPYLAGDGATFADADAGVAIEALGAEAPGYRVRVAAARSYDTSPEVAPTKVRLRLRRHLKAVVRIESPSAQCLAAEVRVERRRGKRFRAVGRLSTGEDGRGRRRLRDRRGRYRAVVAERTVDEVVCSAATSSKVRHRHRRGRR